MYSLYPTSLQSLKKSLCKSLLSGMVVICTVAQAMAQQPVVVPVVTDSPQFYRQLKKLKPLNKQGTGRQGEILSPKVIYAEKTLKKHLDSLVRHGHVDSPTVNSPLDKLELLEALRSMVNGSTAAQEEKMKETIVDSFAPVAVPDADVAKGKGIEQVSTPLLDHGDEEGFLSGMKPLEGYQSDVLLEKVKDKVGLAGQRMPRVKETMDAQGGKEIKIMPRATFREKLSFDGVLGLMEPRDRYFGRLVHISPSLSYRFYGPFSFGVGPDLQLLDSSENEDSKSLQANIGVRSLLKAMLLNDKLYLQLEDTYNGNGTLGRRHRLYVGGGYLVRLSPITALNFSLLYQTNPDGRDENGLAPWLFRLGLSAFN